jgi:putative membrane protein
MADPVKPAPPRAFRLSPQGREEPAAPAGVTVVDEIELPDAPPPPEPRRRGARWGWTLASALGGLALLSLGMWVQDAIIAAMRRSDVLGLAAVVLALILLVAFFAVTIRFLRDWMRERRIGKLREQAEGALAARSTDAARAAAEALVALHLRRPETAAGRARFSAALPQMTDARDILALAEREIVEPLDRIAADEIARAARQVSMVTAVSPRALIDLIFVVFAGARLIRRIAGIYGGRPSTLGLLRIARASIEHLLVTGGLAAGHAVIQQVIGQGLAARLSAKLGEGVLNGLMTARFGLAALTICRPLPFMESAAPTLTDVAAGLIGGQEPREEPPPARQA